MGSWGPRTFEDDIACDWLEDLMDSDPIAFFDHCLELNEPGPLGMLACVGVVCTAEMLCGLLRGPREGLPESAHGWLDRHQALGVLVQSLLPDTVDALDRVLDPHSEMYQQWEDADVELITWTKQLTNLKNALKMQN